MLEAELWQWPLVVAYSLEQKLRGSALITAISHLQEAEREGVGLQPAWCAMHAIGELLTDCASPEERNKALLDAESPLLFALEKGTLFAWASETPGGLLRMIEPYEWARAEIIYSDTCCIGQKGWRRGCEDLLSKVLGEKEPNIWFYDVRIHGKAVRNFCDADRRGIDPYSFSDLDRFDDFARRADRLHDGLWSPLVTLAWIACRNEDFTAAVQLYEKENYGDRPGHTWPVMHEVSAASFAYHGHDLGQAKENLRVAVQSGTLTGGAASNLSTGLTEPILRHQWADWNEAHDHHGWRLLPNYTRFCWPSEMVRSVFPAANPIPSESVASSPSKPAPLPAISEAELSRWFHEKRRPEFEGKVAPCWQDCWTAAKSEYAGRNLITRDKLQAVRRQTCPDWKGGRRG